MFSLFCNWKGQVSLSLDRILESGTMMLPGARPFLCFFHLVALVQLKAHYWQQTISTMVLNNLLFDIPFWIHNNQNVIIKIFKSIHLLHAVIFFLFHRKGYAPFSCHYRHHGSRFHKIWKFVYEAAKRMVKFQSPSLNDYLTF